VREIDIETFYWVAQIGNFRAVAERMNTTQSAISARIRALESELGIELFDRVSRRASLNSAGRQFLQYAEQFMALSEEVRESFTKKADIRRIVRIGVSDTIATTWLIDFMHSANQTYPSLTFEIFCDTSETIRSQLTNREIDIGLILAQTDHPAIVERPICAYRLVWTASPMLHLPKRNLTARDIAEQTIVTFPRTTRLYATIAEQLKAVSKAPSIHCAHSSQTMLQMALRGWCLTVLPTVVVADYVKDRRLRILETEIQLDDLHYSAAFLRGPNTALYEELAKIAVLAARAMS
jgi:DNA-binding transcriptional LysR family regulator